MTIKEFQTIMARLHGAGLRYTPDIARLKVITESWYLIFGDISFKIFAKAMENYIENESGFPEPVGVLNQIGAVGGYTKWQLEECFRKDYDLIPSGLKVFVEAVMSAFDWRKAHGSVKDRLIRESLIPAYLKQQRQDVINRKQIKGEK